MSKNTKTARRRVGFIAIALCALGVCATFPPQGHAQDTGEAISIGTGGVSGVYYPAGVQICKLINRQRNVHGIRCAARSTNGSVDNIEKMHAGEVSFGIVQSDVQFYALKGYGPFQGNGADPKLRSVLSLHPETFTVIARADAGIRKLDDLKGKRVNIGNPGSGQRTTMELVMLAKGWTRDVFAETQEMPSADQSKALCENKFDAMVFIAGHPNASIKEAMTSCDTVLVNATGPAIEKLIKKYPYYSAVVIPGGTYKGMPLSTRTFGVNATLVTSSDVPDKVVYELVQSIFDNFVDFKFTHPAFFVLKPKNMITQGLTAPMHPGAYSYFKKTGNLDELLQQVRAPRRR